MKRFVIFIFFAIAILTASPAIAGKLTLAERYALLDALHTDCSLADAEAEALLAAALPLAEIIHKKAKEEEWHIWFSDVGEHKITVDKTTCTTVPPITTISFTVDDAPSQRR